MARAIFVLVSLVLGLTPVASRAQIVALDVEAVAGEPFGVARVTARFARGAGERSPRLWIEASDNRAFYPADGSPPPVRGLLRGILNIRPAAASAYFLFRGGEPFELTVSAPRPYKTTVRPGHDAGAHRRLLSAWWSEYQGRPNLLEPTGDFPPQVQNYLTTMLCRRLNLSEPDSSPGLLEQLFEQPELDSALAPLTGAEAARVEIQRQVMLGKFDISQPGELPLPEIPPPPPATFPQAGAEAKIEPIAAHVPQECVYLRYGSFSNLTWMRETLARSAGDLRNLLSVRGVNYQLHERMERQLGLKETELSKLLGPVVISDVAMIGADMFLREGAAMGMLFEARNSTLLGNDLDRQRKEAMAAAPDAQEEQVEISGHQVSYIWTPDHRLRSFHAIDGDYHLVTPSKWLVRRFFEAGQGQGDLGSSEEFRHARRMAPQERGDTVFVYASRAFFENVLSPQYRIEMNRRLAAVGNIELTQLAQLAARAEAQPANTIEQLIEGGFLPKGFGRLPDGSHVVLQGEAVVDSLRGGRGSFTPIPDIEITGVTAAEVDDYQRFIASYREKMGCMDPLAVGVRRRLAEGGRRELVSLDVLVTPFTHQSFWTTMLGPPDKKHLRHVPGDLVSAEVNVRTHHLFFGLRDVRPLPSPWQVLLPAPKTVNGYLTRYMLESPADYLMGYLGTTAAGGGPPVWFPDKGFGQPDGQGFANNGWYWRTEQGGYVVLSFQREVLEAVTPLLNFEEAPLPAQARLHVGDISRSNLAGMFNMLGYVRARRTSEGNLRLLDSMTRQLHVPPADALKTAERLLDARLVCPVGETYQLVEDGGGGQAHWVSPALLDPAGGQNYLFPPLKWFRGMTANVMTQGDLLEAHVEIEMRLPDPPGARSARK